MATSRHLQQWARRGTTTQRGLGSGHQALRQKLLPAALGTRCPGPWSGRRSPRCTRVMADPKRMDLDDRLPRALGGRSTVHGARICCSPCNRGHGAAMGNRMRAARRQRALAPARRPELPPW